MNRIAAVTGCLTLVFAASPGSLTGAVPAQQDFDWRGQIASGKTLEVRGINGDVEATGIAGGEAEVVAVKRAKRSDINSVQIEVVEHADGITICAVYPTPPGKKPNRCAPGGEGHMSTHDNDVEVHFTVRVPAGVKYRGSTVNGDNSAQNIQGDVEAVTVNGDVTVSTSGLARATTVNGSIHAAMGRADWTGDLDFTTVNGSIVLDLPSNLNAVVTAATVNGDIRTDFPLTVKGRFSSKKLTGTIGSGGRELDLQTVNGSIELNRGS